MKILSPRIYPFRKSDLTWPHIDSKFNLRHLHEISLSFKMTLVTQKLVIGISLITKFQPNLTILIFLWPNLPKNGIFSLTYLFLHFYLGFFSLIIFCMFKCLWKCQFSLMQVLEKCVVLFRSNSLKVPVIFVMNSENVFTLVWQ